MRQKGDQSPRPKYHFLFPIEETTDADMFVEYMKTVIERFPQLRFDSKVRSPAQLCYGVDNAEITYFDGKMNLTEFLNSKGLCPNADAPEDHVLWRAFCGTAS